MHYTIAKLALDRGANFVSSSYIADDMRELHAEACESKLCLVNEVGLDHLMAHSLVHNYRNSAQFDLRNRLVFAILLWWIPAAKTVAPLWPGWSHIPSVWLWKVFSLAR